MLAIVLVTPLYVSLHLENLPIPFIFFPTLPQKHYFNKAVNALFKYWQHFIKAFFF